MRSCPVFLEPVQGCKLPPLKKQRFIIPESHTMGQVIYTIRKQLELPASDGIFVFVVKYVDDHDKEHTLSVPSSMLLSEVYDQHKDIDGFLYLKYTRESVFG